MDSEDNTAPPQQKERRKESRHAVNGDAVLCLLDTSIHLRGHVLDLSMSGCQFRTDDCFPMAIFRRVEIEFRVDGLPFRLAGVTQSIHKRQKVGIRFLDISERKRLQLQELIDELQEILARESAKKDANKP